MTASVRLKKNAGRGSQGAFAPRRNVWRTTVSRKVTLILILIQVRKIRRGRYNEKTVQKRRNFHGPKVY
jgi:hypothetical protein